MVSDLQADLVLPVADVVVVAAVVAVLPVVDEDEAPLAVEGEASLVSRVVRKSSSSRIVMLVSS